MLTLLMTYLDSDDDKILFETIYLSYRKQMIALAKTILHNEDDAEDAVHSVFYVIASRNWDIVKSIQDERDRRNYLLKATKNTALNLTRKKERENVSLDTIAEYNMDGDTDLTDNSFFEMVCNSLDYTGVVEAIKSMDEIYRDVLYYHFVLELSVPQTARSLNRSVAAVKKQLVRGKKQLLHHLGFGYDKNGDKQT